MKNKVIFWIATGLFFLFEGLLPLITLLFFPQYFNAGTKPLGYPDYFAYALLVFEILGATAIMFPKLPARLKEWAYAGLGFNMIFAVLSNVATGAGFAYIAFPFAIGCILVISYIYNSKNQQQWLRQTIKQ